MQITPKAITALSKLLSQNSSNNKQSQNDAKPKSNQNSKNCRSINNNEFKNFISKPSLSNEPNYSVKNELISVLNSSKEKSVKSNLKPHHSLNYLLLSQQQLSARNSFQKKRPPQINVEESTDIQKHPQSAKNVNQMSPLHYCPNQKSQQSQKSIKYPKDIRVICSKEELLKMQFTILQLEAGTGEGTKLVVCRSARNQEQKQEKQIYLSENKQQQSHSQYFDSQQLNKLYLYAAQILKAYQTKEMIWKQQKQSLRSEIVFLKQLLQQQEQQQNDE
ncbi:unnamed protein product (macronuclear) [Paramecium tetraurelia]|uniref:Uncharacterized protein n=1 Tax=Paramecium tetraurelia TaxID=5888 RepID=A0DSX1_PARTE|nr:uncharacterized protein GSPATT00019831001 [Paramecium tetraurelia]CAK86138.1 unnamed protein product [Paramecium tetraurelia]|eukprot:XP_001453535.1 hypothetical protein (macronuclear) [Paramecium tetraurelia strain d4-2]